MAQVSEKLQFPLRLKTARCRAVAPRRGLETGTMNRDDSQSNRLGFQIRFSHDLSHKFHLLKLGSAQSKRGDCRTIRARFFRIASKRDSG